jgi:hypothetical protein
MEQELQNSLDRRVSSAGLLDLIFMTERTNPVTSDPSTVKVVFWPRC